MSSIAFSPSYGTDSDAFFAAGTLNPTFSNLVVYNDSQTDAPLAFIGGGERSAVTQVSRSHVSHSWTSILIIAAIQSDESIRTLCCV